MKPTETELTNVLTEFYQRGQSESKAVNPPPPFEITSTVQSFAGAPKRKAVPVEDPPFIPEQKALINPENEVDFIATNAVGYYPPTQTFTLQFFVKAHNLDKMITGPCYIRTYGIYYEVTRQLPGGGQQTIRGPGYANFNYAEFYIPPANAQPLLVDLRVRFPSIPPPQSQYINGYVFIPMFVEYVDDGSDMDHIYGSGTTPPAQWYYPPPRSIAYFATIQY